MPELDIFTLAYIEAALWSSTDDNGEPLDSSYTMDDISPETLQTMADDCRKFQSDNASFMPARYGTIGHYGHDFWLTRNLHGVGFGESDYPDEIGERLTDASLVFGEFDLYIGDDGKIHGTSA